MPQECTSIKNKSACYEGPFSECSESNLADMESWSKIGLLQWGVCTLLTTLHLRTVVLK